MTDILWTRPEGPSHATFVFAHGAGAGMNANFMERFAQAAAADGLAVARFEFDYMAKRALTGKKTPPPRADKLVGEYQRAVQTVAEQTDGALIIGGKSMGSRVAAMLAGSGSLPRRVAGVACLGYPFHPTGKPDLEHWRLAPLEEAKRPVLVLQGDRDQFGNQTELAELTLPDHVTLQYLEDGNHDFAPRGASPATWDGNIKIAAQAVADFAQRLTAE